MIRAHVEIDVASGTAAASLKALAAGKFIRVLNGVITSSADDVVTLQSKPATGDSTELTGKGLVFKAAGQTNLVLPEVGARGHFQTLVGEALQLSHSGSGNIGGWLNCEILE